MLLHRRVTPSIKFAGTHLYTWVERGTVRAKCLAQEHNTTQCPRPGLEPGALARESSALTMRPPRLSQVRGTPSKNSRLPLIYAYLISCLWLFFFLQQERLCENEIHWIMFYQEPITRSFHISCTLESTLSRIFLFLELWYLRKFFNFPRKHPDVRITS